MQIEDQPFSTLAHEAAVTALDIELLIETMIMIVIVLAYSLLAPSMVRVPDMSPVIFTLDAPLTEPLPETLPSTASWDAPPTAMEVK